MADTDSANKSEESNAPQPGSPKGLPPWLATVWEVFSKIPWVLIACGALVWWIFGTIKENSPVVQDLRDPAFARGLITFIICAGTLGMGFMLTYQAFVNGVNEESFKRGREVFTGLMGVLGTIVGFYFGASDKTDTKVSLAPLKMESNHLRTHVDGGTPPYEYSITAAPASLMKPITKAKSDDGWILVPVPEFKEKGTLTLDVSDSKGRKVSTSLEVGPAAAPPPAPPPGSNENKPASPPGPPSAGK